MKKILLATLFVGGVLWATVSQAQLTLSLSGANGSQIEFGANNVANDFTITGGSDQWQITSTAGGTGSANGLYGNFSGGPWSIGTISSTTIGSITIQNAPVTTAGGTLTISDGTSLLTGTVNWMQVQTVNNGGSLNASALVNITGLVYSGINADLLTLAQGDGSVTLGFQFTSNGMLTELTDGSGPYYTTYNGTITAVP